VECQRRQSGPLEEACAVLKRAIIATDICDPAQEIRLHERQVSGELPAQRWVLCSRTPLTPPPERPL
jgi:hypothetical protein